MVVRELLEELSASTDASEAAASVLDRASDAFAAEAGPHEHLAYLLTNAAYAPLVAHARAEVDSLDRIGDAARVAFTVHGRDGTVAAYLLSLVTRAPERAAGGSAGVLEPSWRITGLVRRERLWD